MAKRKGFCRRGSLVAVAALALASQVSAQASPDAWAPEIAAAAARFGLPDSWVRRVMSVESGGRTTLGGKPIVSRAGAMGLMQVMPGTWRAMRARHGLGPDPHNPADNILAGTAYLRLMYDKFGYPGLFAAYNSGPARYARFLTGATPLPAETRFYVAAVTAAAAARPLIARPSSPVGLFLVRRNGPPQSGVTANPAAAGLFVALSGSGSR